MPNVRHYDGKGHPGISFTVWPLAPHPEPRLEKVQRMLIAIVSDTHGHEHYTRQAVTMLEQFEVQRILHCGDIGSAQIPQLFEPWPVDYVLGNVDRDIPALRAAIDSLRGHRLHGREATLTVAERSIFVTHGDDAGSLSQAIEGEQYDVVCSGHTHRAEIRNVGQTLVLNPGALFRANPHTFALLNLEAMEPLVVSVGDRTA